MANLIKFEFRKLFKSKLFYVCGIILIASIFLTLATLKISYNLLKDSPYAIGDTTTVLDVLKATNTVLPLLLAVFVVIFVCEDYTSDTIKNIYAKGYSKTSIFFSKYLVSLIVCLIYLAIDLLFKFVFGVITYSNFGEFNFHYLATLLNIGLIFLCYHAFYFMITISIRKLGLCIASAIIIPSIIEILLLLVDIVIRNDKIKFINYSLDGRLGLLQGASVSNTELWITLVYGIIFIAIFMVSAFFINKKRD